MTDAVDILAENLASFGQKAARLYARLPAHLEEFCDELTKDSTGQMSDDELSLSYRHIKERLYETLAASYVPYDEAVADFTAAVWAAQEPILASQIAKSLAARVQLVSYLPTYNHTSARIAYVHNAYSDLAFKRFSRELCDPTVIYFRDFRAVCEELWADRCDFAILPVESSHEGRLSGVEKLIAKYELSPMLFTRVKTSDGAALRFGLYASAPIIPRDPEAVEIIAFADESAPLSHLFTAADFLGCELLDCAALPDERDFQKRYRLVFFCGKEKQQREKTLKALMIFLNGEYPHHLFCGVYKDLP